MHISGKGRIGDGSDKRSGAGMEKETRAGSTCAPAAAVPRVIVASVATATCDAAGYYRRLWLEQLRPAGSYDRQFTIVRNGRLHPSIKVQVNWTLTQVL